MLFNTTWQRNLYNFSLLFASNVENLLAFMLQGLINERMLYLIEVFLGMVYLFAVLSNLYWFLTPLADREEFDAMTKWIDVRVDRAVYTVIKPFSWVKRKYHAMKVKAGFQVKESEDHNVNGNGKLKGGVMAAMRMQNITSKSALLKKGHSKDTAMMNRARMGESDPFEGHGRKSL